MLAGPGTITTIILFTGTGEALPITIMLFAALVISMAAVWIILNLSDVILKVLGKTGVSVIERIIGLLLSGLSIQFIFDGIVKLGFLAGGRV
jgi:multiple antibiotic resistance protein